MKALEERFYSTTARLNLRVKTLFGHLMPLQVHACNGSPTLWVIPCRSSPAGNGLDCPTSKHMLAWVCTVHSPASRCWHAMDNERDKGCSENIMWSHKNNSDMLCIYFAYNVAKSKAQNFYKVRKG